MTVKLIYSGVKRNDIRKPIWLENILRCLAREISTEVVLGPLGKVIAGEELTEFMVMAFLGVDKGSMVIYAHPEEETVTLIVDTFDAFDLNKITNLCEVVFETDRVEIHRTVLCTA